MPKKKNKRKKHNQQPKARTKDSSPKDGTSQRVSQARQELMERAAKLHEKLGVRGNIIFKIVLFFPLLSGALLSAGTIKIALTQFYIIFGLLILGVYLSVLFLSSSKWDLKGGFFYVLSFVLLLLFYGQTQSFEATGFLLAAQILLISGEGTEIKNSRNLFTSCLSYLLLMPLLALLGVFSQKGEFFLAPTLLGFLPGLMLVAAILADNTKVLSWRRSKSVETKEGEKLRPGPLTQAFTLLLILGPMVFFILTPLNFLPKSFFIVALIFIWIPKICSDFLEKKLPDNVIALQSIKATALTSVLVLIAGLI